MHVNMQQSIKQLGLPTLFNFFFLCRQKLFDPVDLESFLTAENINQMAGKNVYVVWRH